MNGPEAGGVAVRALVLRDQARRMRVETVRLNPVGPGQARVRLDVAGVCHSDLSLARGPLVQPVPAVLGHEACGTVLEIGPDVTSVVVGSRVILLWQAPCGQCARCRGGQPFLCVDSARRARQPYGVDADGSALYPGLSVGAFAEQTVVPAGALAPIPDDLSAQDAALLGCAATTGVGAVLNTACVGVGESVCVFGLGGVGLSAVQGARIAGANPIIAVDRHEEKLAAALAAGATHALVASEQLGKAVRGLTGGDGVDHAFDCVGSAAVIRMAWSATRRGGSVTVVGVGSAEDKVEFSALELFHFGRTVRGCVAGGIDPSRDLPRFYDWVRDGRLDLALLRSRSGELAQVEEALDRLARGAELRMLVRPGTAA